MDHPVLHYIACLLADPMATAATVALLAIAQVIFGTDPGPTHIVKLAISAMQIGLIYGAIAMTAALAVL